MAVRSGFRRADQVADRLRPPRPLAGGGEEPWLADCLWTQAAMDACHAWGRALEERLRQLQHA